MKVNKEQLKNYTSVLSWVTDNLTPEKYTLVIREDVAQSIDVPESCLNRSLVLLEKAGALHSKRERGGILSYTSGGHLKNMTPIKLYEDVVAYYAESARKLKASKLAQAADLALVPNNEDHFDTTRTNDAATAMVTMFESHPASGWKNVTHFPLNESPSESNIQLTPAQQLLQQAQALVEAERVAAEAQQSNDVYEQRLAVIERNQAVLIGLFKAASVALFGSPQEDVKTIDEVTAEEVRNAQPLAHALIAVGDEPQDPDTTRSKVVQMVRAYAVNKNVKHRNVWGWLYQKLNDFYGFNAVMHRQNEKELYIDAVERGGQIENLYSIASKYLVINQ